MCVSLAKKEVMLTKLSAWTEEDGLDTLSTFCLLTQTLPRHLMYFMNIAFQERLNEVLKPKGKNEAPPKFH